MSPNPSPPLHAEWWGESDRPCLHLLVAFSLFRLWSHLLATSVYLNTESHLHSCFKTARYNPYISPGSRALTCFLQEQSTNIYVQALVIHTGPGIPYKSQADDNNPFCSLSYTNTCMPQYCHMPFAAVVLKTYFHWFILVIYLTQFYGFSQSMLICVETLSWLSLLLVLDGLWRVINRVPNQSPGSLSPFSLKPIQCILDNKISLCYCTTQNCNI